MARPDVTTKFSLQRCHAQACDVVTSAASRAHRDLGLAEGPDQHARRECLFPMSLPRTIVVVHTGGYSGRSKNAFAVQLDSVIARHMQMGFSVIIRHDDYRKIYVEGPRPRRSRLDSKYGACFEACLAFAPSYIASELQLAGETQRAQETTISFVLEDRHRNVGDARRLFDLFKADALPEWQHFVGVFDVSKKNSPGAQAADFLAYCVYRAELLEHGAPPSAIEMSSYVADTPLVANTYPRRRERHADRYLKPPDEMARRFSRYPEAVARTLAIAQRCRFSLDELA
jgi:hypothetical protein